MRRRLATTGERGPTNGYTTSVSSGIQLVVNFTSRAHRSIVEAECDGARVQFSTGEEPVG